MTELVLAVAAAVRAFGLRAGLDRLELDAGLSPQPAGRLPCRLELLSEA